MDAMLRDFEADHCALPSRADVCVMGAGAAGILLSTQLASAGLQVVLLEGGGLQQEAHSQEIYRSEITGLPHRGIHQGRFRTYGGTTTQWGGQILELNGSDFEKRPWIKGSGWPLRKADLDHYYQRALHFEGLQNVERADSAVWSRVGLKALESGLLAPEFSVVCSRWCRERNFAKLQRRALTGSPNIAVVLHANVVGLILDGAGGSVTGIKVRSFSGREGVVKAERFVVCLGGIETVRLLLQPHEHAPAPWQRNGLLGRHFQDHIAVNGIGMTNIRLQPAHRYFGYLNIGGFRYQNKLQLSRSVQQAARTLGVAGTMSPFRRSHEGRDLASTRLRELVRHRRFPSAEDARRILPHGPALAARHVSRRLFGAKNGWKRASLTVHCEQSPESASKITLANERDALGMRRTKLRWSVSDDEIHSIRSFVKLVGAKFARIEPPKGFFEDDGLVREMCEDSNHHMGGCRMSTSANAGIVDENLKLHGVTNCYLCSSAVFPSSGHSNPTHSVLALAMRLSDRLAGKQ
jgi:choline dehydrogenase-like flavoprotein